jgi:hypothetical protein
VLITPEPEEPDMGEWALVRVGHLNLWRENRRALRDLRRMLPEVDVLTLNEAANHYDAIWEACGDLFGFIHAEDGGYNERQNVILYRKSVLAASEVPTAVELMCEGTEGTPPRFMVSRRLVHRATKRVLKVRVTHMNSHVERRAWWHLRRHTEYVQHARKLRRSLKFSRGTETVQLLGMDCNVNYRRRAVRAVPVFPYALLKTVLTVCSYQALGQPREGTHGNRLIDGVWMMRAHFAQFERQRVITGLGSDHNGLVVTLSIR